MAYRNPLFGFLHAARTAGAAAVTPDDADAAYPKERLIDSQLRPRFRFGTTAANHRVDVDLGVGFPTGFDRLLIPTGHDLNGQAYTVQQDTAAGFPAPTLLGSGTFSGTGTLDVALTASSQRYLRLTITPSGRWNLPELWYTTRQTTTRGPEPGWVDQPLPNVNETVLRSGARFAQKLGARRRQFSLGYAHLTDAERALFATSLLDATSDGALPFWYWPPDDTEAPVLVHLAGQLTVVQDRQNPRATAQSWNGGLSLLESLA